MIVDNEEGTDVDIIDITDPKKAVLIAEYDLDEKFPQIIQPSPRLDEIFLHDMIVKQIGGRQIMLVSYWDAGYVPLDVTDPTQHHLRRRQRLHQPRPRGGGERLHVSPEGNGHQAEFTLDNQYVIAADEDFGPFASTARTSTTAPPSTPARAATPGCSTPATDLTGASIFVGRACPGDPAVPAGDPTTSTSPSSSAASARSPRRSPASSRPAATTPC